MDKIFGSVPNLFVDRMLKKLTNTHIKIVDQLSKVNIWNKKKQRMEPTHDSR